MIQHFLDYLLHFMHWFVILVNTFGWIYHKYRKFHLMMVLLTAFSWGGLGFFYGWGYCFLTDWHWQIKNKLGAHHLPPNYIMYCLKKLNIGVISQPNLDILIALVL